MRENLPNVCHFSVAVLLFQGGNSDGDHLLVGVFKEQKVLCCQNRPSCAEEE